MKKSKNKENAELLVKMQKRFKLMLDADDSNRRDALDDIKFVSVPTGYGNSNSVGEGQWDQNMAKERGNRPMYVFNKLRVTCKRIINEIRSQRPSGKVRGVEGGDTETAEIYEGLIRNIYNISDGDTIVDIATEYQVNAGMGAWRLKTEYRKDSFNQDIKMVGIPNPLCLFCDPSAKDLLKRDAADWCLTEKIPKADYESRYPDAEVVDFEGVEFDDNQDWGSTDDDEVRIAEYWYKVKGTKEIWLLEDGKVIDADTDEAQAILASMPDSIKDKREVDDDKIMMFIASGDAILEGPTEWAGSMFPFVMIFGEYMVVDGTIYWYGAVRWSRDAQKNYNVVRTNILETIMQTPQAKWWVTADQAEGNTDKWAEAHVKNFPFLIYNPDVKAPGAPQRMGSAEVPVALIQDAQMSSNEIKEVTGIFDADLGASNQATSGKQELVRQQQGQTATYNYPDNVAKGIQRTYELLIDLIPKVYDTEQELRIIGSDGAESYKTINTFAPDPETGEPIKINDLNVGTYDTVITQGPSFSTRRQEAAESYQGLLPGMPILGEIAGDLIFKSMDLPYADEIAERLKAMLPPQIQESLKEGEQVPPEVQAMMQQAQQAMQMVEQQMAEVQEAANEAGLKKSEVEKLIANLKTEEAEFKATVAQEMAKIVTATANLKVQEATGEKDAIIQEGREESANEQIQMNAALAEEFQMAMNNIFQMSKDFNERSVEVMDKIQPKRIAKVELQTVNGKKEAVPVYEDE